MKTVLFVCVHNAGRSQMAEAYFNSLAGGKAVGISAGTEPGTRVHPLVVEAMKEVGIDISNNVPKPLTDEILRRADRVITMGCMDQGACPASFVPAEDWAIEDPKGKPLGKVREISDEIRTRVVHLLAELGISPRGDRS